MSKPGVVLLCLIMALYILITQNIIRGYININDKLQISVDNLLKVCTNHKITDEETEPYQ